MSKLEDLRRDLIRAAIIDEHRRIVPTLKAHGINKMNMRTAPLKVNQDTAAKIGALDEQIKQKKPPPVPRIKRQRPATDQSPGSVNVERKLDAENEREAYKQGTMTTTKDPDTGSNPANPWVVNYLRSARTQHEFDQHKQLANDPPVSEAQRRAMYSAAEGHSDLGIPRKVGEEFVGKKSKDSIGGVLKGAAKGGLQGAAAGATGGSLTGIGTVPGALAGGVGGAIRGGLKAATGDDFDDTERWSHTKTDGHEEWGWKGQPATGPGGWGMAPKHPPPPAWGSETTPKKDEANDYHQFGFSQSHGQHKAPSAPKVDPATKASGAHDQEEVDNDMDSKFLLELKTMCGAFADSVEQLCAAYSGQGAGEPKGEPESEDSGLPESAHPTASPPVGTGSERMQKHEPGTSGVGRDFHPVQAAKALVGDEPPPLPTGGRPRPGGHMDPIKPAAHDIAMDGDRRARLLTETEAAQMKADQARDYRDRVLPIVGPRTASSISGSSEQIQMDSQRLNGKPSKSMAQWESDWQHGGKRAAIAQDAAPTGAPSAVVQAALKRVGTSM